MKITLLICLIFACFTSVLYASEGQAQDTTIITDLNSDGVNETITVSFPGKNDTWGFVYDGNYIMKVGSQVIDARPDEMMGGEITIIDVDKSDNFRELLITSYGASDFHTFHIYRYDGTMRQIGTIVGAANLRSEGNGGVLADKWMGFWTKTETYNYDPGTGTFAFTDREFYDVNQAATVKKSFKVLKTRLDDGEEAGWFRPDAKITVVKADLTPNCNTNDGYNGDDFFCDWYLIRGSDGMEGWIRIKDLQDNVEGLIWAG